VLCFALLLIYIFLSSVSFCTSGNLPENHRVEEEEFFCDTALTNVEPRTETTPENQDSADSRVEIATFE